ncbi:MAG TPA: zinc ribbon domain-containing protein [Anaerolineae bacterium]|nr:zinc ribbon domain-containing protein [Anaerolineae bacterium]
MPIHEFECLDCHEQFEQLVRFSTRPEEVACPQCGAHHARKRISLTAAVGRGDGASGAVCAPTGG